MTNNHDPTTVVFFGTPQIAATILERLLQESTIQVVAVVTNPDRPAGRSSKPQPSAVKTVALEHEIDTLQPQSAKEQTLHDTLAYLRPDLFVIAAYGHILPGDLLTIPQKGALNVHPSLLPRYRGPSPIAAAIQQGDAETGVTIMLMDEKMDHGPILAQKPLPIDDTDTTGTLTEKLTHHGYELLVQTIPAWMSKEMAPQEQDHEQATYTKLLTKRDGRIDWSQSARSIERHIRAMNPWPGAYTFVPQEPSPLRLVIIRADVHPRIAVPPETEEGVLTEHNKKPVVTTGAGVLELVEVKPEGKRTMNGADFLNGYRTLIGKQLL